MANIADPDQLASSEPILQKPVDLDLPCLQRQGKSGFSRIRVNYLGSLANGNSLSVETNVKMRM